ncbi:MAG: sugar O-acetyltransferase [Muribaculaceae bacterium]|nr:sugar O-acetyltransferase [Muribaculaceae bacterium]
MTELNKIWNKMIDGEEYDATHPGLRNLLQQTRMKLWQFNSLRPDQTYEMNEILRSLFGSIGERFIINQPFRCDYGCNIFLGEDCFINFNCTILDEAKVTIGNNAFLGPNVSIYTACHPLEPKKRNRFIEWAEGVTIGNNVWIGGDVTILPGVSIGDNVVIGAGAVVTKSFPSNVVIGGNPARIIKHIHIQG